MTDTVDPFSDEAGRVLAEGLALADQIRARIKEIETARGTQAERLATARAEAEEARGWSLLEELFEDQFTTVTSVDGTASLALSSVTARELLGARLCFDLLDCGDDYDQIDEVISRLFTTTGGDTGLTMVIMAAALSTAAARVVPQLLNEIEQSGSNWDTRVRLCEARAKAWHDRIAQHRNSAATEPFEEGEP